MLTTHVQPECTFIWQKQVQLHRMRRPYCTKVSANTFSSIRPTGLDCNYGGQELNCALARKQMRGELATR